MLKIVVGLIVPLMCGSSVVHATADAEQFAEGLGSVTASAMACGSTLAGTIRKCLDQIIEANGFTGDGKERVLQAYKAGIAKEVQASAEDSSFCCGDVVRDIKKQTFWARCTEQASKGLIEPHRSAVQHGRNPPSATASLVP